jgi:hypothetical protein
MSPDLKEKMRQIEARNELAKLDGTPALERLVEIAHGDHGQAHHVRLFLLGMYNGQQWPFDLSRVRLLDPAVQEDVLKVMALDWTGTEVHRFLEDGDAVMRRFWSWESG